MAFSRDIAKRMFALSRVSSARLTNEAIRLSQNKLFNDENARQLALISRIEKVSVKVKGPHHECTLIMNKGLSTPYNCTMHLSEHIRNISAMAIVNGQQWDMHRPLVEDCEISFKHFQEDDPRQVNQAYWRSCTFVLGYLATRAFKDDYFVELHSWPSPNIRSGSFIYDVDLKLDNWSPTKDELRVVSIMARKLTYKQLKFERLVVDPELGLKIFEHNRFKKEQVPQIAASSLSGKDVTLYRLDDHIDISRGPMISNTGMIGVFDLAAVYPIKTEYGTLHRFQGVSLPQQIKLNYFAYSILIERAAKMNPGRIPQFPKPQENVFETPLHTSTTDASQQKTF